MPAIPQISDAEWEVMKAVWDWGPLTAGQVVDRLAGERQWKPRTVKTLLNRLVRKGAVAMETDGRRYVYRAKVPRDAVIKRETRSFLSRVFDGAAAPAIVHFIEQGRLTPDEIRQLRETLDRESRS
ncbi:MAG TPA: BlaI/MecI/CopY family transcriptional regulator [Tepidisphaeraceae bacterium]|jgi:BlaI family penicillinase repressor|nr:BlaI/MecI/CopY family transcriptional regulator [Tepidisphaeraceae bacterium]